MLRPSRSPGRRGRRGTWGDGITHHAKGYLRIKAGPLRDQLMHRIVAAAMLGRPLKKDEEVHHRDGDRTNCWFTNLFVIGQQDHGWVSQRQKYFMAQKDAQEKAEWDAYMNAKGDEFLADVAAARAAGEDWACQDGMLRREWEEKTN